jgi:hypothetical protein
MLISPVANFFGYRQPIGIRHRPEVGTTSTIGLAKVSRNATISYHSPAFDRANIRENTP